MFESEMRIDIGKISMFPEWSEMFLNSHLPVLFLLTTDIWLNQHGWIAVRWKGNSLLLGTNFPFRFQGNRKFHTYKFFQSAQTSASKIKLILTTVHKLNSFDVSSMSTWKTHYNVK